MISLVYCSGIGDWAWGKRGVWEVWEDVEEIFPPTLPTLPTLPHLSISPFPLPLSPFPFPPVRFTDTTKHARVKVIVLYLRVL